MRKWRAVIAFLTASVAGSLLAYGPVEAASSPVLQGTWVPNGTVYAIARHGDRLYVGGTFTAWKNLATGRNVQRARVAALDATTGELVTAFNPVVDLPVRTIAVSPSGSEILLGGDFTAVNTVPSTRLAALDPSGALVPGWQAGANASVRDLLVADGGLYVAGKFATVNGEARRGLARLDPATGVVDPSWVANAGTGRPLTLTLSEDGTRLVVGGNFLSLDGVPRAMLASVGLADGAVTAWNPPAVCETCTVFDVAVGNGRVYGATGGGSGGRAASWDAVTGARQWIARGDGDVQAVAVGAEGVYAGGHFGPDFAAQPREQLAELDPFTGAVRPLSLPFTGMAKPGIWALQVDGDTLRVGGGFQGIEGTGYRKYVELVEQPDAEPPAEGE